MKKCNYCGKIKEDSAFEPQRRECKSCRAVRHKIYAKSHKEKLQMLFKNWLARHREERKRYCKQWYLEHRKAYQKYKKEYTEVLYKEKPWLKTFKNIQSRLHPASLKRKKNRKYQDIKNLLTEKDVKFLWFRDKAYLMKSPSIHRKDSKGDYSLGNCIFLELAEHRRIK